MLVGKLGNLNKFLLNFRTLITKERDLVVTENEKNKEGFNEAKK